MMRNVAAWPRGRRAKWVVLAGWLLITMAVAGPLAGKLAGAQKNDTADWLPSRAEATQVAALQQRFQGTGVAAAVVVYERRSGITPADRAKAAADARALAGVAGVTGQIAGPIASRDGQALQIAVPLEMGPDGWGKIVGRIAAISRVVRSSDGGLTVRIAGPASFDADSARAFQGIDHTLLLATVAVVVLILLLAYRSPVLWLLPVMSAGVALASADAVIYLLARSGAVVVNGESAGILTVLVFGVGTDYALLLVARYKEELRAHADRHQAMAVAMRRAGPAIAASAATVAVSLLCLRFAQMNSTRGLGPVAAIGVGVALLVMITLLPALLVIFGRWVFWPARPAFGTPRRAGAGLWGRAGAGIARRPRLVWAVTALVLAGPALGVTQLHATGLTAGNSFTSKPESVIAQQVLARHFPAGQDGQPVVVTGNASAATRLQRALAGTSGIAAVSTPALRDGLVLLDGTLRAVPDSAAAIATVQHLRAAVHAIPGADAKVGGQTALTIDMRAAQDHDNKLIIPLVLLAMLMILGLLLRAVVAPLLLAGTVVLSFGSALGISALLFRAFGFHGADGSLPLLVFVFLVALGIDYNIFLMTRVREEAQRHGTRHGMLTGLASTGGVITSAGLVLAATFSVFATIPTVFAAEIGTAIALGVLLDTFIVRSVLVTALTLDIGRLIWWPGRLAARQDPPPVPVTGQGSLQPASASQ